MKGFIEVTYQETAKYTINVSHIIWFVSISNGKKTGLTLQNNVYFVIDESYDEIKAKIEKAVQ